MRHPTNKSVPGFFCEDIKGGYLVACSECHQENESREPFGYPLICTNCKRELHYDKKWNW